MPVLGDADPRSLAPELLLVALVRGQVWSLTQFNSIGFLPSRIVTKKCVFNKHTIRVCFSFLIFCAAQVEFEGT